MARETVTALKEQIASRDREIEVLRQQLEVARLQASELQAAMRLIGTLVADAQER